MQPPRACEWLERQQRLRRNDDGNDDGGERDGESDGMGGVLCCDYGAGSGALRDRGRRLLCEWSSDQVLRRRKHTAISLGAGSGVLGIAALRLGLADRAIGIEARGGRSAMSRHVVQRLL